jgi:hypothetical protein
LVSLLFAISARNSLDLMFATQSDSPVLARSSDYGVCHCCGRSAVSQLMCACRNAGYRFADDARRSLYNGNRLSSTRDESTTADNRLLSYYSFVLVSLSYRSHTRKRSSNIVPLECSILEEVLALYRTGRYSIASPEDATISLGHLATLLHRNQVEMVDCIPELRLRASANADR